VSTKVGDLVRVCFNATKKHPALVGPPVRVTRVDELGIRYWSGAGRRRFLWRAESWIRVSSP